MEEGTEELGFCVAATMKRVLNYNALKKADVLEEIMLGVASATGLQVVKSEKHQFEPHGASVCLLLSESHFACHTWPEHAAATVHIYACCEPGKATSALATFARAMSCNIVKSVEFTH